MHSMYKRLLIQPDEVKKLIYFIALFLVIGTGMALGRATAETLLFKRYGIEYLPYVFIALSVFLASVSLLYAAFADRIKSESFLIYLAIVSASLLSLIWLFIKYDNSENIYPVLFIVYEIVSELFLVHCSFYIAQNITQEQSKRLLPLIMAGNQSGILFGGLILSTLVSYIGVENIILVWIAIIVFAAGMTYTQHLLHGTSAFYRSKPCKGNQLKQAREEISSAFKFTRTSSLLWFNALALFFMVITFYLLYYVINSIYTNTFNSEESLAGFLGYLTALTGILTLLIQILVTNKLLNKFSINSLNYIYPITTLVSFILLTIIPGLTSAIAGSINKDAIANSIRNPVQAIFYNVLPVHMQGRARALSIIIIIPIALIFCAGIILFSAQNDSIFLFCLIGITGSVALLFFTYKMNQHYFSSIHAVLSKRFLFDKALSPGQVKDTFSRDYAIGSDIDDEIKCATIKLFITTHPDQACHFITKNFNVLPTKTQNIIINEASKNNLPISKDFLHQILVINEAHLHSSIITALINYNDLSIRPLLVKLLSDKNPRLKATAILGCVKFSTNDKKAALQNFNKMLEGAHDEQYSAVCVSELLNYIQYDEFPETIRIYTKTIHNFLNESDTDILSALRSLLKVRYILNSEILFDSISQLISHTKPEYRLMAAQCVTLFNEQKKSTLLQKVLRSRDINSIIVCANSLIHDPRNGGFTINEIMNNNSYFVYPASSKALITCFYGTGINTAHLVGYTRDLSFKAHYYLELYSYLCSLSNQYNSFAYKISIIAAKERARDYCSLALTTLGYIEDFSNFNSIYTAAISGDPNYQAQAIEFLKQSKHKDICNNIVNVILNKPANNNNSNLDDYVSWCQNHDDQWLYNCLVSMGVD